MPPLDYEHRSRALIERARQVIPGGVGSARRVTSPIPETGAGGHVFTLDGERLVDLQQGAGAIILGHADPEVDRLVQRATGRGIQFGMGVTQEEVAFAEAIVQAFPGIDQALFTQSGTEATGYAVRLARAVTGREKVVKFVGCYHGHADGLIAGHPLTAGVLSSALAATVLLPYNDIEAFQHLMTTRGDEIAAVIVEPIAHNGPGIMPLPGFLETVRDRCTDSGALLVFDEVITCRHGAGGYQGIAGITPDLTTIGKAVANGYPLAVLGGRRDLMERWATHPDGDVLYAGTYAGNLVGMIAGLATREQIRERDVHATIAARGEQVRAGLRAIVQEIGVPAQVMGYGSIFSVVFTDRAITGPADLEGSDVDLMVQQRRQMRLLGGVYATPDPDGYRCHLGAAHTDAMVGQILQGFRTGLRAALDLRARPSSKDA